MTTAEHTTHENHAHAHGDDCGHLGFTHGDHTDYAHDGHIHRMHDGHADEHDEEERQGEGHEAFTQMGAEPGW